MRKLCLLLFIILSYSCVANADTQTYNFTIENNTALDFENGYYIIEIIGIDHHAPKHVKVNLSTGGSSKIYKLYEGEDPWINSAPFDKIDLRATSIISTSALLKVEFPEDWTSPNRYTIKRVTAPTKLPELVLTKSVDKLKINVGDVVEIKIKVENTGNGTANNLEITELFPKGFSRAPGSRFPPVISSKLDPGKSDELYYALKAVESGTFNLEPTTISYDSKTSKSNSISVTVSEQEEEKSNLKTTITLDKNDVATGDLITVAIKVTNIGKTSAESILIEGEAPVGFTLSEGDLRQVYNIIDPGELKEYTAILKAEKTGNYSINLKTVYNHDSTGTITKSENIKVTKKNTDYLIIIMSIGILIVGVVLFTIKRHKEYSF